MGGTDLDRTRKLVPLANPTPSTSQSHLRNQPPTALGRRQRWATQPRSRSSSGGGRIWSGLRGSVAPFLGREVWICQGLTGSRSARSEEGLEVVSRCSLPVERRRCRAFQCCRERERWLRRTWDSRRRGASRERDHQSRRRAQRERWLQAWRDNGERARRGLGRSILAPSTNWKGRASRLSGSVVDTEQLAPSPLPLPLSSPAECRCRPAQL